MLRIVRRLAAAGLVLGLAQVPLQAQEAEGDLPPPRQILPEAPAVVVEAPVFQRANRYAVWQYYGVDRYGYFRPLVAYGPHGAYYLYSGEPYPWAPMHPRWWVPNVVGTPSP
jgi:hypothetical protein